MERENTIPLSKIKKWYAVEVNAYKVALDLAKDRFDDVSSESESVTNKAIKMIGAVLTFVGFFTAIILNTDNISMVQKNISLLSWGSTPIVISVLIMVLLLFPKKIAARGLPPDAVFIDDFDNEENNSFHEQLIYYSALCSLQGNINFMVKKNKDRALIYKISLYTSIVLLLYIPALSVFILTYHS